MFRHRRRETPVTLDSVDGVGLPAVGEPKATSSWEQQEVKIGTKLIGSFIIVALICGIVGGIGYYGLTKTASSIDEIGGTALPSIQNLQVIKQCGTDVKCVQRTMLDPGLDKAMVDSQMALIGEARTTYEEAWKTYEPLPHTPREAELWKQFVPAWNKWRADNNVFFQKIREVHALDLGNPYELEAHVIRAGRDHYLLEMRLHEAIQSADGTIDTVKNSAECAFGRWYSQFTTSNPELQALLQEAHAAHERVHRAAHDIKSALDAANKPAAKQLFDDDWEPAVQAFRAKLHAIEAIAVQGTKLYEEARQQAMGPCLTTQTAANDLLDQIVKLNQDVGDAEVKAGTAAAGSAKAMSIGAVIVGVLLALGFGFVISRAITKPISLIVARIKDIAQGEGDLTQRVDDKAKDELGELGRWFNAFVKKVHDIVAEVAGATREVASAATQIAASSEEMAQGMSQQTQQTTQVSSAVEEMSSTVVEVARKSADAAGTADDAGKQATEGGRIVAETVTGMKTIAEVVNSSASAINELGKRGEQIGQIIGVINDIADQTNLLALNAAIEAARAGEHGRGFAVVADEVRKLAERTTQATEEVAESIKAIQSETNAAVERMSAGHANGGRGREAGRAGRFLAAGHRGWFEQGGDDDPGDRRRSRRAVGRQRRDRPERREHQRGDPSERRGRRPGGQRRHATEQQGRIAPATRGAVQTGDHAHRVTQPMCRGPGECIRRPTHNTWCSPPGRGAGSTQQPPDPGR
jgi:methyl-accepting chemotaxis protein